MERGEVDLMTDYSVLEERINNMKENCKTRGELMDEMEKTLNAINIKLAKMPGPWTLFVVNFSTIATIVGVVLIFLKFYK